MLHICRDRDGAVCSFLLVLKRSVGSSYFIINFLLMDIKNGINGNGIMGGG